MTVESLARLVGEGVAPVRRWLSELRENEVFSSTEDGLIYSRRMVRDEAIRDARAAGGPAGAEHGHKGGSHGAKGGRPRKEKPPLADDERGVLKPAPSSSSPSSSPSPDSSDADASGGEPPKPAPADAAADPEKVMFDSGRAMLMRAGKTRDQAGSLLGKWKRDHDSPSVIAAIGAAHREGAEDPVSFITACLERRNGQRPHHHDAGVTSNAFIRQALAEQNRGHGRG
jgi:hypothetical protein